MSEDFCERERPVNSVEVKNHFRFRSQQPCQGAELGGNRISGTNAAGEFSC